MQQKATLILLFFLSVLSRKDSLHFLDNVDKLWYSPEEFQVVGNC